MSKLNPSGMATKDLLALYNDHAKELGEGTVARFADRESAERRTVAMHDRVMAARAATVAGEPLKYNKAGKDRVMIAAGSALDAIREAEPELVAQAEKDHGKRGRKPTPQVEALPGMTPLGVKAPAATIPPAQLKAPTPLLATKRPRWAAPKGEQPCKRAVRPRPGSSQEMMYLMLTRPGGVAPQELCDVINGSRLKRTTAWTPATTWSSLRWLFVASKGYGLKFDGEKIWLLVPSVEVDAVKKPAAE